MSPLKKLQLSASLTEQAHHSTERYMLARYPGLTPHSARSATMNAPASTTLTGQVVAASMSDVSTHIF